MSTDAWATHDQKRCAEAHRQFTTSPGYVERCATAAQHGYRPATLSERMFADPTRLYSWNGGLWCANEVAA